MLFRSTAGLNVGDHVILLKVSGVVACNEVSLVDVVRALDGAVTETEVRDGDTGGLLGVILEVCLNKLVGVVTDDLDGVLVSTNGTVSTETPELTADCTCSRSVGSGLFFERKTGDVVNDTDGEVVLGSFCVEVFVGCEDGCRSGSLQEHRSA